MSSQIYKIIANIYIDNLYHYTMFGIMYAMSFVIYLIVHIFISIYAISYQSYQSYMLFSISYQSYMLYTA